MWETFLLIFFQLFSKYFDKRLDFPLNVWYTIDTVKEVNETSSVADTRKEIKMDEMNLCEAFERKVEENQLRKVLELLNDCTDLDDAKAKIKALLNK